MITKLFWGGGGRLGRIVGSVGPQVHCFAPGATQRAQSQSGAGLDGGTRRT